MANTLLTPSQITREAMRILENTSVLTRNADRQYDKSFAADGAKIGDTLRIRIPDRRLVTDGPTLAVQDTTQQKIDLVVGTQKHVDLGFSSQELAMSIDEFSALYIEPCVSQLATSVDLAVYTAAVKEIGNSVGTPGTTPATTQVLLAANQKLSEMATPGSQRYGIVNPAANAALVEGMKGLFNPAGIVSDQFKEGLIGKNILQFREIAMSQNVPQFTTGSRAGTILVNGAIATQGATTITIDGATASTTIKKGDVFTVASVYAVNPQTRETTGSLAQFVATADVTLSGTGTGDITVAAIYTSAHALATVDSFPADNAALTFVGGASTAYPQNLALHKNALAFVTADLPLPKGMDMASRVSHNGISLRFIRGYDIQNDRFVSRIDVFFGSKVVRPEMACRIWG